MSKAGTTLGRFRLERELGRGAHGQVWLATDTLLGEQVALKFLRVDGAEARERLKREVVLARRVQHRGICRVNDLHDLDGQLAISMQLVGGVSLDELMASPVPLGRALRIIDRLADAVAAAHAEKVLHRDLKPANINVDSDDEVVVLDFGIASATDLERLTAPGVVVGTLRYVAPEVLTTGQASQRSDLYAIAVIAWALLSGRLPWAQHRSVVDLVAEMERGAPDVRRERPEVSPAVAVVLNKALAADPDDRFADVAGFRRALGLAVASSPAAPAPSVPQHAATQVVRRRALEPHANTTTTITVRPAPLRRRGGRAGVVVAGALVVFVVVVVAVALSVPAASPSSSVAAGTLLGTHEASVVEPATVQPPPVPETPAAQAPRTDVHELLAASSSRARSLGLRRGDAPAWDAALATATEALRKDPASKATAEAVHRATQVLQAVNVDMGLVMAKLQRFNAAVDLAIKRDPAMREKVTPSSTTVARAIANKDAGAANRALNAAFAVLERR
jgi:hypothetical protein